MYIQMRTLAASPERILEPGKAYNLRKSEGEELCNGGYAVKITAAEAHKLGLQKIPPRPDPEDLPEQEIEDEKDDVAPASIEGE